MPIRPLSDKLQQKAKEELNEVPERIHEDIEFIRDWLEKQPHLKINAVIDDQWILNFLRGCKFSLPRTTEKLDLFFTIRSLSREIYADRDPLSPKVQEILKRGIFIPIANVEDGNPAKLIILWNRANSQVVEMVDLIKVGLMFFDLLIKENDNFIISGQEVVHDMTGFSLMYMTELTPAICKKVLISLQQAYPTRLRAVWHFYATKAYEFFINMFKQFMEAKIKERLKIFEAGFSAAYTDQQLVNFPKEYGGQGGSLDEIAAEWKKKFETNRDWFLLNQELMSDESKRIGKPRTSAEMFGVEGSFRKLGID